ncbi:MAG: DUF4317 domain-containing protein [Clostridia bacterium]|nr:DUF4317 domain-containing protein [Clostridia bacterium]
MTEKELREIKRHLRPEKCNIPKIVGCFVNENKTIISRISQSILLEDTVVAEKLLGVMRKTLSGTLGTNLVDIPFSTKQVSDSAEHALLMKLVKTELADKDVLESFYEKVIESVKIDGNYVILLANDRYDVFSYGKDGEEGESCEMFSYVICAVCPVKNPAEALSFGEADSLFHLLSPSSVLSAPELGFMFPSFDDRRTNIYNALYYTRSTSESYPDFTERVFAAAPIMPPKIQKATFSECLSGALSEECSLDVVMSVRGKLEEMIEAHKESKDPEPLTVSKATVNSVLEDIGVTPEKIEKLGEVFDEEFGKNAELSPKNIVSLKKVELTTPEVSIKVDPEHRDVISTDVINGVKYVMIRVTGPVEVNGINISIEE